MTATADAPPGVRIDVLPYRWRNARGAWVETSGLVYRPEQVDAPLPLVYVAGYEADPQVGAGWVAQGCVLVTTRALVDDGEWPHGNPLARTLAMDEALLRAARRLPYVDDSRVAVTGGSAGGYMALMNAAATFPLSIAAPAVPPVNLPYQLATWRHALEAIRAPRPDGSGPVMAHPGSPEICGLWSAVETLHGRPAAARLWQWSPLAHLDRITSPVLLWATTADALVPIPQLGVPIAQRSIDGAPAVYPIDPQVVCTGPLAAIGRRTLLGTLDPDEVRTVVLEVPDDAPLLDLADPAPGVVLPAPVHDRRWLVVVIDEGPPDPDIGHFRYAVGVDTTRPVAYAFARGLDVDQLTRAKLDLLVDRYLGLDWVAQTGQSRGLADEELDDEREDVRRGVRTWSAQSPAHEARLVELAAALPADRGRVAAALLA